MPSSVSLVPEAVASRRETVVAMTKEGRTQSEIATALGVTTRTVQRMRRSGGVAREPVPEMTAGELVVAEAMLDDGCSFNEVARTLGRSDSTIWRRFPGRGWTMEQRREQISWRKQVKALLS